MYVTKYFLIGKVSIASSWIALILSFIVAYGVLRIKYGKSSANLLGDAIFYFIIVWKLSVLITDFKTVLQFPLSIIYFNGGTVGVFLGISAAAIKIYVEMLYKGLSHGRFISLLLGIMMIQSIYQIFIALFNEGPLLVRLVTVISFSAFILTILLFINQLGEIPLQLILLMIGVHLFISALQPAGFLQTPMFVALGVGAFMMIVSSTKDKYDMEALN